MISNVRNALITSICPYLRCVIDAHNAILNNYIDVFSGTRIEWTFYQRCLINTLFLRTYMISKIQNALIMSIRPYLRCVIDAHNAVLNIYIDVFSVTKWCYYFSIVATFINIFGLCTSMQRWLWFSCFSYWQYDIKNGAILRMHAS